jgi:molybdate transport system regulatory protein
MKLAYKIWLENDGKAFGEGPFQLLRRVIEKGSLSQASKSLEMSYQKAWLIIRKSEERLGFSLLERKIGGLAGGGSQVTAVGQEFMENYARFRKETEKKLNAVYQKHFGRSAYAGPTKIRKGAKGGK